MAGHRPLAPADHSTTTPTLTDSTMGEPTPESSHASTPYPESPKRLSRHQDRVVKPGGPFKCTFKGCNRDKAFTNKNDLERHMKSVHGIRPPSSMGLQSYSCKGRDCTGKSKIWPRLDNFRAHCLRMHPKEDLESLIQRFVFFFS